MHHAASITYAERMVQAEPWLSAKCEAVLQKKAIYKHKVLNQLRKQAE